MQVYGGHAAHSAGPPEAGAGGGAQRAAVRTGALSLVWLCRYTVVTRPIRQGRLKLALEEVLSAPLAAPAPDSDAPDSGSSGSGFEDCQAGGAPEQEWASRGTSQSRGTSSEAQLEREVRTQSCPAAGH